MEECQDIKIEIDEFENSTRIGPDHPFDPVFGSEDHHDPVDPLDLVLKPGDPLDPVLEPEDLVDLAINPGDLVNPVIKEEFLEKKILQGNINSIFHVYLNGLKTS